MAVDLHFPLFMPHRISFLYVAQSHLEIDIQLARYNYVHVCTKGEYDFAVYLAVGHVHRVGLMSISKF